MLIERGEGLADETLANKGIFLHSNGIYDKAQRALILAAKNGYPEALIAVVAAKKKALVDAEPGWTIERP